MNIVTIGGGTGHHALLSGLKSLNIDLTAIVTVADSGGSTGRLRDEFGYLPMGDFRMALVALADEDSAHVLRKLFLYRFDKGAGLKGHNFGNIFLVALTDILKSEAAAFRYASKILNVKGKVVPISNDTVDIFAKYEDGSVLETEGLIDSPPKTHDGSMRIKKLSVLNKNVRLGKEATEAISAADYIIMGPGDLYTSLIANLVIPGVRVALRDTKAKFIYISNLVTKYGQTHNYGILDHLKDIEKYTKRKFDYVLVNKEPLPKDILIKYAREKSYPVFDDLKNKNYKVVRKDFLAEGYVNKVSGDAIKRSLIRHDSLKLASAVSKIINGDSLSKIGVDLARIFKIGV